MATFLYLREMFFREKMEDECIGACLLLYC